MTDKRQSQANDAKAQAAEDATPVTIDPDASETVEGGKYEVNGVVVNANGEPLNEKKS